MKNPMLITGASGVLGRSVVTAFAGAGLPVRQAVRNLKEAKPGVDPVRLDYSEPATIGPALTGIGGLLLMAASVAETFSLFLPGTQDKNASSAADRRGDNDDVLRDRSAW